MKSVPTTPLQATPPWSANVRLRAMGVDDVDRVHAIEQRAYAHPWTRGNFMDSIQAGHWAQVAASLDDADDWLGYIIAMHGVDEMHLLNVTVKPESRRQGLGRWLLQALAVHAHTQRARKLWLEVRPSNGEALALYQGLGFAYQGVRKAYYPSERGAREDAIVMMLELSASSDQGATHAA